MTKQANVDLDLFIQKQLLGPEKPGRLYRQHQQQMDFRERINPRTKNIAHSLRITPYLKAGNDGPSTPVRVYDGKVLPNFGGGRIGKVRPKKIASIPLGERERNAFQLGLMMNTDRDKLNAINTEKALSKGLKIAQAKSINLFKKDGITPLPELGQRTNQGMLLQQEAIKQGKEHLIYGFKDTPEDIETYQGLLKSNPEYFK